MPFAASRLIDADGLVRFTSLPTGHYRGIVQTNGSVPLALEAEVPGPPIELVLPVAGSLRVRLPELVSAGEAAVLSLIGDGEPFSALVNPGELGESWLITSGVAAIEHLPPGTWRVEIESTSGRRWTAMVDIQPGRLTEIDL